MWTNQGKGELSPKPCYRTEVRDFNGKESFVLLFEESARFAIEVSFTNPVNSNSTCKLPLEEHFKTQLSVIWLCLWNEEGKAVTKIFLPTETKMPSTSFGL